MTTIQPSLCQHLVDNGLGQAFCLTTIRQQPAYQCPACVVDNLVDNLGNLTPSQIASRLEFKLCGHAPDGDRCMTCSAAVSAEVVKRWAAMTLAGDFQAATGMAHLARQLRNRARQDTSIGIMADLMAPANAKPDGEAEPSAATPAQRPERYPGEAKRLEAVRKERRAAGLPVRPRPLRFVPGIGYPPRAAIVVTPSINR